MKVVDRQLRSFNVRSGSGEVSRGVFLLNKYLVSWTRSSVYSLYRFGVAMYGLRMRSQILGLLKEEKRTSFLSVLWLFPSSHGLLSHS